ncbi:MAG: YHS domain-containing (seleno)protein [Acidobacteriota bacterium]
MKKFSLFIIVFSVAAFLIGCHSTSKNSSSVSVSSTQPADARKSPNGLDPVNKVDGNLALKGYDVVAYFTEGKAVEGATEFTYDWQGARWQFVNAANREAFMQAPEKYAPQFGGYCAWAVGHGYTANGDPTAWKIVNGKLYLNYNQKVKEKWEQDEANLIKQGDENFPGFLENKPEHKG